MVSGTVLTTRYGDIHSSRRRERPHRIPCIRTGPMFATTSCLCLSRRGRLRENMSRSLWSASFLFTRSSSTQMIFVVEERLMYPFRLVHRLSKYDELGLGHMAEPEDDELDSSALALPNRVPLCRQGSPRDLRCTSLSVVAAGTCRKGYPQKVTCPKHDSGRVMKRVSGPHSRSH